MSSLAEAFDYDDEDDVLPEPRFERIGGVEYAMGSPGIRHQMVLLDIGAQLRAKLKPSGCTPVIAPFDVYPLFDLGDERTFVQPDLFTICDQSRLDGSRYLGAPKFIIEILSRNRSCDMITKMNLYLKAGVEEYWMIDPDAGVVTVLELADGRYINHAWAAEKEVPILSFPGCTLDFSGVFDLPDQGRGE